MEQILVTISDMKISHRKDHVLVTHSLGSCLGLTAHDPLAGVGGLIHCLLPRYRPERMRADHNPFMFVNTGVPEMIRALLNKGAERGRLVLKAAGCARMLNVMNQFDTGAKNFAALQQLLQKNNVALAAQETGGTIPRTMYLHIETGKVTISSCGKQWEL